MKENWKAYAALAAVVLATSLLFLLNRAPGTDAALTGLPLDDSWIHLVYARSLAEGLGFAYNPGTPEAGFTSPLWVLLLAPGFWVPGTDGLAAVWIPKTWGIALAFLSAAWTAGLIFAADPGLAFARLSGMEVMAAVAAVLWTLLSLAENRPRRAGAGIALCALARPELAVFAIAALPALWAQLRGAPTTRAWRSRILVFAPVAVAGAAWMLYNLSVIGHPLPATFYAKAAAAGTGLARFRDIGALPSLLSDLPWFAWGAGVPLFAVGAWRLVRAKSPAGLLLVFSAFVMPLAVVGAHWLSQPSAFFWARYFMPAIPFLYLPVAVAVGEAAARARERRIVPAALLFLLLVPGLFVFPGKMSRLADLYAWNSQNINEMQVALALWIRDNVPAGEMLAVTDAGAFRFLGGHEVLDLYGLNNHKVLFGSALAEIAVHRPRFFAIFPSLTPQVLQDPTFVPVAGARAGNYTICDCDQSEIVLFERGY